MTEGTSQGLFVVVAIVIFGIFVGLTYTLFGSEGLSNDLKGIFENATEQANEDLILYTDEQYFEITEDGTIIDYTGNLAGISNGKIPNYIRGIKVVSIGEGSFYAKDLVSVTIPDTVTKILGDNVYSAVTFDYNGAFENNSIASVTLPTSLEFIGNGAFRNNALTEINLPKNMTQVSIAAFQNNKLTEITIPKNTVTIMQSSFRGNNLATLNIPSNVKEIHRDAFRSNLLTEVTFKGPLDILAANSFTENNLNEVVLPNVSTLSELVFDSGVIIK